ncbi:hypothetical protein [Streptomonospora litoralis]|uniref:Head-to-tail adaptor n=1 Tax=Streptomonospora litoralis TaxID=2498135 RepID=A0A4P6PYV7_9ACTN|nr:hypothetical protein [Streptomonospora litoralis]QBI53428.1 hypothetical protein EKD16_08170 [Streptomonospora litoralis]
MAALASQTDIEARLGRALTTAEEDRVEAVLDDASAIVRNYTRQDFGQQESTQILRIINGRVRLPQRPVLSVSAVGIVDPWGQSPPAQVPYMFDGIDSINLTGGDVLLNAPEWWADLDAAATTAEVTWTHGYATTPGDVVAVVCGMVIRQLLVPQQPGVRSEQAGGESISYADALMTGTVTLTRDDRRILNRYRTRAATVQLPW